MLRTYAKDHLPADDDPRWERWQKRPAIVRMMPLRGPCQIVTVDAPTELPEGWEGWLAIDAAGHPYPLHKDVQAAMYVEPDEPEGIDWWGDGKDKQAKRTSPDSPLLALKPGLAPDGLVFRHCVDGQVVVERRLPATEVGLAGRYAAEDGNSVLEEKREARFIETFVYDGDTGELLMGFAFERATEDD